jgi:hypothetical protein
MDLGRTCTDLDRAFPDLRQTAGGSGTETALDRRYSLGVTPYRALNARPKWVGSTNPHRAATALTGQASVNGPG